MKVNLTTSGHRYYHSRSFLVAMYNHDGARSTVELVQGSFNSNRSFEQYVVYSHDEQASMKAVIAFRVCGTYHT
jgi:hypothetical protein